MIHQSAGVSRREFLHVGALAMAAANVSHLTSHLAVIRPELAPIKALVFDVFGTVVDWRSSVTTQVEEFTRRKGLNVDGARFADAWRARYRPIMDKVRTGVLLGQS